MPTVTYKQKLITRSESAHIPSAMPMASTGYGAAPATSIAAAPVAAAPVAAPAAPRTVFRLPNGVKYTNKNKGDTTAPAVREGDDVEIYFIISLSGGTGVTWYDVQSLGPLTGSRSTTFKFTVGDPMIIEGLNTGIIGMHCLGERHMEIPPTLGFLKTIPDNRLVYGAKGRGAIPLESKILMRVKLCHVVPHTA
ncbi:hypothetical protein PC9H_009272 [Pleurotus ostreatus]|uniref:peptidylprolyl isomerase n=1 Tax=Pleurotus ostreatus TaxID=5322 RepID=A0A8H7DPG7_PLEOS|nr:uncharacterized protein PC9H_009272 [Pleurotus ostreatus]KAF7423972.1 hypothetical protein PC9H_009272 [Pleurotus ostreatus]KAJ8693223.1 peptidylprolyl isomerase fpr3 [Pleurotus ostreatus]